MNSNKNSLTIDPRSIWIQTYSGVSFYPLDPRVEDVNLLDISTALSNICRFTGHCEKFYSVAQHSVWVAEYLEDHGEPLKTIRWGLMHDSAEAYIGDVSRPIKKMVPLFSKAEGVLLDTIGLAYDLGPMPSTVKHADNCALASERRFIMSHTNEIWEFSGGEEASLVEIVPETPEEARESFLSRCSRLGIYD